METRTFHEVWSRIDSLAGVTFTTKRGLEFTYELDGNAVVPIRDGQSVYRISMKDFEEVFATMPLGGPGDINDVVRGPAYVWAILNDKRITGE